MNKLILLLVLLPTSALGAPTLQSDPVVATVTHCGVYIDNNPKITIPVTTVSPGVNICSYDLQNIAIGSHQITMTAIAGTVESPKSDPYGIHKAPSQGQTFWWGIISLVCDTNNICYRK